VIASDAVFREAAPVTAELFVFEIQIADARDDVANPEVTYSFADAFDAPDVLDPSDISAIDDALEAGSGAVRADLGDPLRLGRVIPYVTNEECVVPCSRGETLAAPQRAPEPTQPIS